MVVVKNENGTFRYVKSFDLVCEVCEKPFKGKTMFATVCGDSCRTRRWRETEKGKACVARSNAKLKRPDINKVCSICKEPFVTAREDQGLCSECSGSPAGNYEAQKRHRAKNESQKVTT